MHVSRDGFHSCVFSKDDLPMLFAGWCCCKHFLPVTPQEHRAAAAAATAMTAAVQLTPCQQQKRTCSQTLGLQAQNCVRFCGATCLTAGRLGSCCSAAAGAAVTATALAAAAAAMAAAAAVAAVVAAAAAAQHRNLCTSARHSLRRLPTRRHHPRWVCHTQHCIRCVLKLGSSGYLRQMLTQLGR